MTLQVAFLDVYPPSVLDSSGSYTGDDQDVDQQRRSLAQSDQSQQPWTKSIVKGKVNSPGQTQQSKAKAIDQGKGQYHKHQESQYYRLVTHCLENTKQ